MQAGNDDTSFVDPGMSYGDSPVAALGAQWLSQETLVGDPKPPMPHVGVPPATRLENVRFDSNSPHDVLGDNTAVMHNAARQYFCYFRYFDYFCPPQHYGNTRRMMCT